MPRRFCSTCLICIAVLLLGGAAQAHPGSGIVVDAQGQVYFTYTNVGVMRIGASGEFSNIHAATGGHWLALDSQGSFSRIRPTEFERITPDGVVPALIFASGGAPLVVGVDGALYYGTSGSRAEAFPPGALAVARLAPNGQKSIFAPALAAKLSELKDGITAIAAAPDGSIYVATWKGLVKLASNGSIVKTLHPIEVRNCDSDPADHKAANASSPFFRGIAVDSRGNIYLAATSCHRLIRITAAGRLETILQSERPWSATGVTVHNGAVYVLEYTNANGPATEGWTARVRKVTPDGSVKMLTPVMRAPAER